MRVPRWVSRGAAVAVVVAGAVLGGAQAASAHDSLVSASPSTGETVTTLSQVSLTFSANLVGLGGGNVVVVVGPDGRHYETDCTTLAGPTLTTPVALGAAGQYEVTWRAVSSDGHPVSGTYAFTYAPVAGAPAAQGSAASVCAAAGSAGQTAAPTDATAPAASGMSGLTLGLVLGGVAVVLVGVVVVIVLRTRSGSDDED